VSRKTPKPPPWKRRNPRHRTGSSQKLTDAQKAAARRRAHKAGRRYPNLVQATGPVRRKSA